jgi:hypothetical protein
MSRLLFAVGLALIVLAAPVHVAKNYFLSGLGVPSVSDVSALEGGEKVVIPKENLYLIKVFDAMTLIFLVVGVVFMLAGLIAE